MGQCTYRDSRDQLACGNGVQSVNGLRRTRSARGLANRLIAHMTSSSGPPRNACNARAARSCSSSASKNRSATTSQATSSFTMVGIGVRYAKHRNISKTPGLRILISASTIGVR